MLNNKEIYTALRQINEALSASINEAENSENIAFFKESIKQAAIDLFSQAQLINVSPNVKSSVEIKFIKTEELTEAIEAKTKGKTNNARTNAFFMKVRVNLSI